MADQASGYLQRKVDDARRCYIQERLQRVRLETGCCGKGPVSAGPVGGNSGYLQKRVNEMPDVVAPASGIPASAHLKGRVDALNNWIRDNDRFAEVAQRRPIPACTLPPNTVYNAGLPIPVPRFRCVLINNMLNG